MKKRKTLMYTITKHTKAIITKDSSYYRTKILVGHKDRYATLKPEEILRNNCLAYGVSMEGRIEAAKNVLNINSKVPFAVCPDKAIYMIPTVSAKNKDCAWISYFHIAFYEQRDDKTYIGFTDGTGLFVNVSESQFDMQYKRTGQLIAHDHRSVIFGSMYINSFTPELMR